jgi:DNA polymerase III gamma/tau subunit
MYFPKIVGNKPILLELSNLLAKKELPNTLLFTGTKGIGKYSTALELSRYLVCAGVGDSTCSCETCRQFPNTSDFIQITLEEGKKLLGLEAFSGIEDFFSLLPFHSDKRVLLIDDAEKMSIASQNKLLKISEELSPSNVIILVAHSLKNISSALVSRFTKKRFSNLDAEESLEVMKSLGVSTSKIRDLKGQATFLKLNILNEGDKYLAMKEESLSLLENLIKKTEDNSLNKISDLDEKESLIHFVEMLIMHLSNILKIHFNCFDTITNQKYIERYDILSQTWSTDLSLVFIEELKNVVKEYDLDMNLKLMPRLCLVVSKIAINIRQTLQRKSK